MTRSVAWTLTRVWQADLALGGPRQWQRAACDLAKIERDVRANLPAGVLTPRDLRDAALQRVSLAPAVLGAVELDRVVRVAPVWRPLLAALARSVPLAWRNPGAADVSWFPGEVDTEARAEPAAPVDRLLRQPARRSRRGAALDARTHCLRPRTSRRDRDLRHDDRGLGRTTCPRPRGRRGSATAFLARRAGRSRRARARPARRSPTSC